MIRLLLFIILLMPLQLKAQPAIALVIKQHQAQLYYPLSVQRFYKQTGYRLAWIAPDTVKMHAWDALMLMDCVLQYGLQQEDYHPKKLLYDTLHTLIKQPGPTTQAMLYDIFLTDAMIRFINNLHYGKLNPVYTPALLDKGRSFNAGKALQQALQGNNFTEVINAVQPRDKLYLAMQRHTRLLVGQQSGDCYVTPPALIQKMAINMERLRWANTTGKYFHLTCIIQDGVIINYNDTGKQDEKLMIQLYNH